MPRLYPVVFMLAGLLTGLADTSHGATDIDSTLASPRIAIIEAERMIEAGNARSAVDLLEEANRRFPENREILGAYGEVLFSRERYGLAFRIFTELLELREDAAARARLTEIDARFEQYTKNLNLAIVVMQKNTDAGNFDTSIAIGDRAIAKFEDSAVLYNAKGEAQYRKGDLDGAEVTFRRALQIDPFNREARSYVEEIRSTEVARTSTELAEWISIAKDKVGDFIVTFLALFAAFLVNSLVAPIVLRIKLRRARRLFERGYYDVFTDLIEGLCDKEDFAPLRANFRFMLREKSFEDAKDILDRHVNAPDRLPTLLRILEREHEKMALSASETT